MFGGGQATEELTGDEESEGEDDSDGLYSMGAESEEEYETPTRGMRSMEVSTLSPG